MGEAERGSAAPILEARELRKVFIARRGGGRVGVRAVDGVSFALGRAEVLALVGESGSGKTTTGRLVLRLIEPSSGWVRAAGFGEGPLGREEERAYRRAVQMIFQDPYASMNPHFRVRDVVEEPLLIHRVGSGRAERRELVDAALERVKLSPAA